MLLDGDDPDDDGEDGFIDGEEDGADAEDHLVLDGPDFNVLDNAFQQDLEAAHEGGLNVRRLTPFHTVCLAWKTDFLSTNSIVACPHTST